MHYGTPATMDDVLPYYTDIRRGSPPSDEQLKDLKDRYEAIGGPSPLNEISNKQAQAIRRNLARKGIDAALYIGAKHAPPFVADAVEQMAYDGISDAVGVVLAPHYSRTSIGSYMSKAREARDKFAPKMRMDFIDRWGTLPALIDTLAGNVAATQEGLNPEKTLVIFSAHSLPERAVSGGDPYKEELLETSRLVAEKAALPHWTFGFQSASSTGEPWIGPDILDVIRDEAAGRFDAVIACTVGFVSDHLEVLYDLGIEARETCEQLGLTFRRAECVNDNSSVMDALALLVADKFSSPVQA